MTVLHGLEVDLVGGIQEFGHCSWVNGICPWCAGFLGVDLCVNAASKVAVQTPLGMRESWTRSIRAWVTVPVSAWKSGGQWWGWQMMWGVFYSWWWRLRGTWFDRLPLHTLVVLGDAEIWGKSRDLQLDWLFISFRASIHSSPPSWYVKFLVVELYTPSFEVTQNIMLHHTIKEFDYLFSHRHKSPLCTTSVTTQCSVRLCWQESTHGQIREEG